MISTCFKSSGKMSSRLMLPENPPNAEKPSLRICVYRPSSPWIRTLCVFEVADVCCTLIPVLSLRTIETFAGRMLVFSSTSSSSIASTRVGTSSISRPVRVDTTVTSPTSLVTLIKTNLSFSLVRGNTSRNSFDSYPGEKMTMVCSPSGIPLN